MGEQLNLLRAAEARDEGLRRVARDDFMRAGLEAIAALPRGWVGTAQEIRPLLEVRPHHFNAWGALVATARRRGLLRFTGKLRPGALVSTHAHKNPVYERT